MGWEFLYYFFLNLEYVKFNMYRIEFQVVPKWQKSLNGVFTPFSKWRLGG